MTDFIYFYISVRNEIMLEKLTILISSEHKNFIQRHARLHNKSISKFIDDLLSSVKDKLQNRNRKISGLKLQQVLILPEKKIF